MCLKAVHRIGVVALLGSGVSLPVMGLQRPDIASTAMGARFGIVDADPVHETAVGAFFWDLGEVQPQVAWNAETTYWTVDHVSDAALLTTINLLYELPDPNVTPFFGVGLGLHLLNQSAVADFRVGGHFQVGTDLELTAHWSATFLMRVVVLSEMNQFHLALGPRYRF